MVDAKKILGKLNQYEGESLKLAENQNVFDIIAAISHSHKVDAKEYDKIYMYFIGKTPEETAKNIFSFLKKNTRYFMESADRQTVKSPAAILKEKYIDCKNYALFAGGILDAINRSGLQEIPFVYRFVSHNLFNTDYNHVLVVVNPDTYEELYIDPIPENSSIYKTVPYYYHTDKKFNTMALYRVSGKQVGADPATVTVTAKALTEGVKVGTEAAKNLAAAIFSRNGVPASFFNRFQFLRFLDNSVGQWKSKSAAMRNWTPEQRISYYIDRINQGDSYHNAVQQYAELYGNAYIPSKGTPDDRGKVPVELLALFNELAEEKYFKGSDTVVDGGFTRYKSQVLNNLTTAPDYKQYVERMKIQTPESGNVSKAGTNMLLTFAIVGAGLFFALKKSK